MESLNFTQIESELRNYLSDPVSQGGFYFEYLDEEDPDIIKLWGDKAGQVLVLNRETFNEKVVPLSEIGRLTMSDLP